MRDGNQEVVMEEQGGVIVLKLIFGLTGVILLVLAYVIGMKKKVTLIAGYDPEKCTDEAGLARFGGIMTFLFGLVVIVFPWVYGPERAEPLRWLLSFAAPIVILVIIMIVGTSRYEGRPAD
jgi:hypothetical protein